MAKRIDDSSSTPSRKVREPESGDGAEREAVMD
jgi:hypothetical protein